MIIAKQVFVGGLAADWIDDWLATNLWVVRLWFTGLGLSEFPVCAPLGPPPWSLLDLLGSLWAPLRSSAGSSWVPLGPSWTPLGRLGASPGTNLAHFDASYAHLSSHKGLLRQIFTILSSHGSSFAPTNHFGVDLRTSLKNLRSRNAEMLV